MRVSINSGVIVCYQRWNDYLASVAACPDLSGSHSLPTGRQVVHSEILFGLLLVRRPTATGVINLLPAMGCPKFPSDILAMREAINLHSAKIKSCGTISVQGLCC